MIVVTNTIILDFAVFIVFTLVKMELIENFLSFLWLILVCLTDFEASNIEVIVSKSIFGNKDGGA